VYVEQPYRIAADRCAHLLALSAHLDTAPGPGGSRCTAYEATKALYEPALQDLFPGSWRQAMIVALYPSSQLVGHRDPKIAGRRYHVPLHVNEDCWVFHHSHWQQLAVGHCYQMDPADWHGAVNWGTTVRYHLVIDYGAD